MRRTRLSLKNRPSLVSGPCRAPLLLPLATRPAYRARRAPHSGPAFWESVRLAARRWCRLSKRTNKIVDTLSTCLLRNWSRASVRPTSPLPARPPKKRQILRRRSAIMRRACSSQLREAMIAERSARYFERCAHVVRMRTQALSSFWKLLARMMCRVSTSISPDWRKERPIECSAGLLALLRASFARSRRLGQVAGYRRIPESLSGTSGACAAGGGVPCGGETARGIVVRPTAASLGLAARRDHRCGRSRELANDDRLARSAGRTPYSGGHLSRNRPPQY